MQIFRLVACSRRRDRVETDWRERVEREVRQGRESGLNPQEIVERVAKLLFQDDLRDLGWVLDLGYLRWEAYLEDATSMVDWLVEQEREVTLVAKEDRRSA